MGFVVDEVRTYLSATADHSERAYQTDSGLAKTNPNNDVVMQQKIESVDHPAVASISGVIG